ncbi:hypothetical protein GOP47_0012993 [Adiantum capillus-veneris]|uniref:Serine aminopeptidase S33 domain-containing protein n=1 Tax=Adiantum capillus-veneris TaxID=13818 RepID=A0A9D4ZEC9_ADICA|nr:hypothetical protein GOP47_0012489 [Adiantum capillus-veneris]KAI5072887.1 hypothetical protein GOP47_0012993 [Adiantum capillus-veneris]
MLEKLSIPNGRGEKLVGILEDTTSSHVIILCHGFRSSKEDGVLSSLSSTFIAMGLSTFRFDFSGSGESEGTFQYGSYWTDAEDLRCVVCYWRAQGRQVDTLVGHSKGGNAVLLYASKYKDVGTLVNISGRFHLKDGIKKRLGENYLQVIESRGFLDVTDKFGKVEYRVTKESLKERLNTDMEAALGCIPINCRVLTVHGSRDETVSCEEARSFDRLISNHTLRILDDAGHYFRKHHQALNLIVGEFVKVSLKMSSLENAKEDPTRTKIGGQLDKSDEDSNEAFCKSSTLWTTMTLLQSL